MYAGPLWVVCGSVLWQYATAHNGLSLMQGPRKSETPSMGIRTRDHSNGGPVGLESFVVVDLTLSGFRRTP
jgi:hypothetical protein